MDTNLVIPRGIDRTDVIFDFYFATCRRMPAPGISRAST
jgi:hypothetical protein